MSLEKHVVCRNLYASSTSSTNDCNSNWDETRCEG